MSVAFPLLLAGCGAVGPDGTDDPEFKVVSWRHCGSAGEGFWFAHRNEPGSWESVELPGGEISFEATRRLTISYGPTLQRTVISLTRDELETMTCPSTVPATRTITGTVAGLQSGQFVRLFATGDVVTTTQAFSLAAASGPVDIFAFAFGGLVPKVIVRRDVSASTVPPLDFSSTEAVPLATATMSVNAGLGSSVGDVGADWTLEFVTPRIRRLIAGNIVGQPPAQITYHGVPASLLRTGELHVLTYNRLDFPVRRTMARYEQAISGTSVVLGPYPSSLTAVRVDDGSCQRYRASIPWQTEYDAGVSLAFIVRPAPLQSLTTKVIQTGGYRGSSTDAWTVEMPDYETPQGDCPYVSGSTDVYLTRYGGVGPLSGPPPAPGTVARTALENIITISTGQ